MEQTGLLVKAPSPSDFIAGAETAIKDEVRVPDGNWRSYLPQGEKQYSLTFDTMSCVTFSATNCLEIQLDYLLDKLPQSHYNFLKNNGYIDETGHINFSDRYTAIKSETTRQGNYLPTVANSMHNDGLIPESDFPMGGTTWEEYHDKSLITPAMDAKAKEFLKYFDIFYDWVFFDQNPEFTDDQRTASVKALKTSPIQIGVPVPAGHAITMFNLSSLPDNLDHYEPFIREQDNRPMHFGMRLVIYPKTDQPIEKPKHTFTTHLSFGMRNEEVRWLQKCLIYEGLLHEGLDTGYFGNNTLSAVKDFQAKYGIKVVGEVGPITRKKLAELYS